MPRLSLYILRQLIGPTFLFAFLMTSVIWLTQSLRLLDLVINRGQSAPTFLYLSTLLLPSLIVIVLPIAFFAGTLYALNRLSSDSELLVMASAGYSRAMLAVPVLAGSAIVMAITYFCGLYLAPTGQRAMKDKVMNIRADIGAALLNEGVFNTPAKGLTVFIREIGADGTIRGVLVHDNRVPKRPVTYLADGGQLAQTPAGARLLMFNGTVQQSEKNGAQLSVLQFERYVFDLDQFASAARASDRATSERYLSELFSPPLEVPEKLRNAYLAEAHNRLSQPLYCVAFALIALAGISRGRRMRGAMALRLGLAALAAIGLRIAGYAVQGLAARNPSLNSLFYLLPLAGALGGLFFFVGLHPRTLAAPPSRTEPNVESGTA